jgi:SAM-dependent methyltransferase
MNRCRVCEAPAEFAFSAREMMIGLRETFDYVECRECGCLQIAEIPANLDRFYDEHYYTEWQRRRRSRRLVGIQLRRAWTRFLLSAPPLVARIVSGRRHGRYEWLRSTDTGIDDEILDVGCGSGRLLYRLHAGGFAHLTGIDARFDVGDRNPRGPRFERAALEEHTGRYHLVMAHHSFEHMADPRGSFEALAKLVDEKGWLLLRMPVADSWARRHYGADWAQFDAPRHLHLHTRRSIEILAAQSGFRVSGIVDDSGPFQIWGSELYRRDIALSEAGRGGRPALGLRERIRARRRARVLARDGLGDQACFYLERES